MKQIRTTGHHVSRRWALCGLAGTLAAPVLLRGTGARAQGVELPDYYPAAYTDILEGSKAEGGVLTIYSNIAITNWQYILQGFEAKFPWLKVKTNDLGNAEAFERYYNETATGVFTADMLFNSAPRQWLRFLKGGHALDYDSPEKPYLPDWSLQFAGLYHLAAEPMVMAYNKALLPAELRPRGIADLARIVSKDPKRFRDKVTSFSVDEAVGFDLSWKYTRKVADGWDSLATILPDVHGEVSSGSSVEKLSTGEALAGYFVSGPILWPRLKGGLEQLIGWNYIEEGQPLALRTLAITRTSRHPDSARLFLDYVQSHEGQVMAARGRMTPIRDDLTKAEAPLNYARLVEAVGGKENILLCDYDGLPDAAEEADFISRWHAANRVG